MKNSSKCFLFFLLIQGIFIAASLKFGIGEVVIYFGYMIPLSVIGAIPGVSYFFSSLFGNDNTPLAFFVLLMFPAAVYAGIGTWLLKKSNLFHIHD